MFNTQEGPKVVQAASLALAVMKVTKKTWSESRDDLDPSIILSPEQIGLLDEFTDVLELVAPVQADGVDATVTLYACEECGRYGYISGGTTPKTCNLKLWCTGNTVKASAATKVKTEAEIAKAEAAAANRAAKKAEAEESISATDPAFGYGKEDPF